MRKAASVLGTFAAVLTVVAPVFALSVTPVSADPTHAPLCRGGDKTQVSGYYPKDLRITGNDYVAGTDTGLVVAGNLTIAPNACLDAFSLAHVKVNGSIFVEKGATLALGCSPGAIGPVAPCYKKTTTDMVGGSIIATQPWSLYLTADSIAGSVISTGGGPGLGAPPTTPYVNFPIKENTIGGDLVIEGWQGGWSGALRNTVAGNFTYSDNQSAINPDSNEVVTNSVGGNLVCENNSPAVGYGDSGGSPDVVGGNTVGQCTAVVQSD